MKIDQAKNDSAADDVVVCLVSLKRYERPDAGFEARCVAGIRQRIREREDASAWLRLRLRWAEDPMPLYRLAAAAAVVVILAGAALVLSTAPWHAGSTAASMPEVAEPLRLAVESTTNPVTAISLTNVVPLPGGGVQFGTGGSMPVRYDY